jgi:hypothetical protein
VSHIVFRGLLAVLLALGLMIANAEPSFARGGGGHGGGHGGGGHGGGGHGGHGGGASHGGGGHGGHGGGHSGASHGGRGGAGHGGAAAAGRSGGTAGAAARSAAASRAPSVGLSPQCREARQTATISGAAAAVAAGTCFATRNPAPCAAAGVAAVKFAADAQKMIKVCQPPPARRPAPPRVAPHRRGR